DVKFFEDIFPFKQHNSIRIDISVQDVNHLNFFNTDTLDDHPDIPNDEERRNPGPIRHGNPPFHSGSTFAFSNENDARNFQDADVSASENGSFAANEDNINSSKGNDLHDHTQEGKLKYFLGIEVLDTPKGVCLNQRKYCLELIDEFGLLAGKPSNLPMQPNVALSSETSDTNPLLDNATEYQKLIGKLIYLTTTRPNISYIVSCISQFMHNPLRSHLRNALQHIQMQIGLDVMIQEGLVPEAEYRALASVTSEVIWILKFLKDLKCSNLLPVKVFCDSNSAIKIAINLIFHERTKHLEIDLHFVREKIIAG
nr:ribonuclease H-like domain-containing protein [Tanacetum cinerariifolium]